jgi:L-threonylcarbamoyladenylate synthase
VSSESSKGAALSTVDEGVAALRAGEPVVLPFDTVYGLAAREDEASVRRLYELKGRPGAQPTALVAHDVESLIERIPELAGQPLMRGPFTLIVPNPTQRFPWLTGTSPDSIGVRIPQLTGVGAEILARVGVVVATSANHPGGRDPATLAAVPEEIRVKAAAVVDGGELPGTPSTVVDLTGDEPRILREGAVSVAETMRRLETAVRSRPTPGEESRWPSPSSRSSS